MLSQQMMALLWDVWLSRVLSSVSVPVRWDLRPIVHQSVNKIIERLGVSSRYRGPKIFFACGAPRIPLEISKETVFSLQCFSFAPGAVLGGAYMLVRHHACSYKGVVVSPMASAFRPDGFR